MNIWEIINGFAVALVVIYGLLLFAYVLKTRYNFVQLGKKEEFNKKLSERWADIVENVFGQSKLLKDRKMGLVHVIFFYGFLLVQFGALDFMIKGLLPPGHLPIGRLYPVFTFFQEIVVLLILIATIIAFNRRYIEKLVRLKRGFKNGLVLLFIAGLMLSTLLGNGMYQLWQGGGTTTSEPVASAIATMASMLSPTIAAIFFFLCWWVHLLLLLAFLVYVPQSKHFHLITGVLNVVYSRQHKNRTLRTIDLSVLEELEDGSDMPSLGVGKIQDFTQKQLLDLYACVECGRCTNVCPATNTGKLLSPMDLIVKLRNHLTTTGAAITSQHPWVPTILFKNHPDNQLELTPVRLIGDVITEEELWACTTCRNCEEQCPVLNEHVDKVMDLRRYLILSEGKVPADAGRTMNQIERQGNPWGINRKEREKWRWLNDTITVPTVKELAKSNEKFDYLFWVGSMGSFDPRSQKIALAFARLMQEAGVKFAILGNEEKNSGDTARRFGNEFLFQELAMQNIAEFEKYNVTKIVTIDPHAYNLFKNEYSDLGWQGDVLHHTELLYMLIQQERLTLHYKVEETVVYHDSCYLGRYNTIYDPPRAILKSIAGLKLVEMERNREKGMCCGAGGGLMWMEEQVGNRINVTRTEQAIATSATTISSGCPYCLTMLSDGTKAKEVVEQIATFDIAELLEKAVFG